MAKTRRKDNDRQPDFGIRWFWIPRCYNPIPAEIRVRIRVLDFDSIWKLWEAKDDEVLRFEIVIPTKQSQGEVPESRARGIPLEFLWEDVCPTDKYNPQAVGCPGVPINPSYIGSMVKGSSAPDHCFPAQSDSSRYKRNFEEIRCLPDMGAKCIACQNLECPNGTIRSTKSICTAVTPRFTCVEPSTVSPTQPTDQGEKQSGVANKSGKTTTSVATEVGPPSPISNQSLLNSSTQAGDWIPTASPTNGVEQLTTPTTGPTSLRSTVITESPAEMSPTLSVPRSSSTTWSVASAPSTEQTEVTSFRPTTALVATPSKTSSSEPFVVKSTAAPTMVRASVVAASGNMTRGSADREGLSAWELFGVLVAIVALVLLLITVGFYARWSKARSKSAAADARRAVAAEEIGQPRVAREATLAGTEALEMLAILRGPSGAQHTRPPPSPNVGDGNAYLHVRSTSVESGPAALRRQIGTSAGVSDCELEVAGPTEPLPPPLDQQGLLEIDQETAEALVIPMDRPGAFVLWTRHSDGKDEKVVSWTKGSGSSAVVRHDQLDSESHSLEAAASELITQHGECDPQLLLVFKEIESATDGGPAYDVIQRHADYELYQRAQEDAGSGAEGSDESEHQPSLPRLPTELLGLSSAGVGPAGPYARVKTPHATYVVAVMADTPYRSLLSPAAAVTYGRPSGAPSPPKFLAWSNPVPSSATIPETVVEVPGTRATFAVPMVYTHDGYRNVSEPSVLLSELSSTVPDHQPAPVCFGGDSTYDLAASSAVRLGPSSAAELSRQVPKPHDLIDLAATYRIPIDDAESEQESFIEHTYDMASGSTAHPGLSSTAELSRRVSEPHVLIHRASTYSIPIDRAESEISSFLVAGSAAQESSGGLCSIASTQKDGEASVNDFAASSGEQRHAGSRTMSSSHV